MIIKPRILRLEPEEITEKLRHRFFSKVMKDKDGCLVWTGGIDKYGYGKFYFRGSQMNAHRFMLLISGYSFDLQDNVHALHNCPHGKRHCVDLNHLYIGSIKDNMRDMVEDGNHVNTSALRSSLSHKDVRMIRKRVSRGETHRSVAEYYGLARATVTNIINGWTWSYVN